ncbi:MAG: caspase family protein [Bacteroidales bacterium]|nr:caspase family protein [Bacteroidales bacterium]
MICLGQQEDKAWAKINGDKDMPYVLEMLDNSGFTSIVKLKDEQATKAKIVNAFNRLAKSCKTGDIVYVHYSGHGQQMRDVHNDESDGLDECWIPYDAYRSPCAKDRGEKHLTDDEVNKYLNNIRNKVGDSGKILVVIDACHSGDGTRGNEEEVVRGVTDIFEAVMAFFRGEEKKDDVANPDAKPNAERWITLSACESNQVNIEMRNPVAGKLTYALYKKIREIPNGDNNSFMRQLRMFMNKNTGSRPQRPVLTGETNRYNITDIIR